MEDTVGIGNRGVVDGEGRRLPAISTRLGDVEVVLLGGGRIGEGLGGEDVQLLFIRHWRLLLRLLLGQEELVDLYGAEAFPTFGTEATVTIRAD